MSRSRLEDLSKDLYSYDLKVDPDLRDVLKALLETLENFDGRLRKLEFPKDINVTRD